MADGSGSSAATLHVISYIYSFEVLCAQLDVKHDGSESDNAASINTGATSSECRGQLCQLSTSNTPVMHSSLDICLI